MHGTTVPLDPGKQQSMARLEALARLMDGAFVIPGTTIRFGLDGIIGLIPVAGDMIAGLVSTYLIWEARQLGAPSWLIARMLANAFLDTTIGAIPVVGDAFDVLFRANMKNMALLRRHLEKKGYAQPVRGTVIEITRQPLRKQRLDPAYPHFMHNLLSPAAFPRGWQRAKRAAWQILRRCVLHGAARAHARASPQPTPAAPPASRSVLPCLPWSGRGAVRWPACAARA